MTANHEDVLYNVEKRHWTGRVTKRWAFRTRAKAYRYKIKLTKANKNSTVEYGVVRVEWGPDNV